MEQLSLLEIAEKINAGNINPYDINDVNWLDATLYHFATIKKLLDKIDINFLYDTSEAIIMMIEEEISQHPGYDSFKISSGLYSDNLSVVIDPNTPYRYEIEKIRDNIIRRKKAAKEYSEKMNCCQDNANDDISIKSLVENISTQYSSIAKGKTVAELMKRHQESKDFTPLSPTEIAKLAEKLESIDTKALLKDEYFKKAYEIARNTKSSIEEDWFHAAEICCNLRDEIKQLKDENEKLHQKCKRNDKFHKYVTYENVVKEIAKTQNKEKRGEIIDFFRILLSKTDTEEFITDINKKGKRENIA